MKILISFVMILAIVAATAVVPSVPASAEQTDIWQVNGKYTLTKKKLVTYCALYSADSGMKKKKRTFKITSATKFIHVTPSYNKKKIKKSQIGKYIKKIMNLLTTFYRRRKIFYEISSIIDEKKQVW